METRVDSLLHPIRDDTPRLHCFVVQYGMSGISGVYRVGYKKSHDQQGDTDEKSVDGSFRPFSESGCQIKKSHAGFR
ncbi:MAG: hypothetical protein ACYCUY_11495 [Acidithiobacillus sp.]